MKIAIDAMGGDHAPEAVVKGSIEARDEYKLNILLSGREAESKGLRKKHLKLRQYRHT